MNLEGKRSTLEGTWRGAKNRYNQLQLKEKDNHLAVERGEQGPGREGVYR